MSSVNSYFVPPPAESIIKNMELDSVLSANFQAGFPLTSTVGEKWVKICRFVSTTCLINTFVAQQPFGIFSRHLNTRIFIIATMSILKLFVVSVIVLLYWGDEIGLCMLQASAAHWWDLLIWYISFRQFIEKRYININKISLKIWRQKMLIWG